MREISKETYININDFICGLNAEQLYDFYTANMEKQKIMHSYILQHFRGEAPDKTLEHANFIFGVIIRSYEYEYGTFPFVTKATLNKYSDGKNIFIVSEMKRHSRNKVISGLRKEAGQRELMEYLDIMIDGDAEFPARFLEEEKIFARIAFYLIVIFLNEEMEKME